MQDPDDHIGDTHISMQYRRVALDTFEFNPRCFEIANCYGISAYRIVSCRGLCYKWNRMCLYVDLVQPVRYYREIAIRAGSTIYDRTTQRHIVVIYFDKTIL